MTQTSISAAAIRDVGIYEEAGAIVLGFQFSPGSPFEHLIFQIDTEHSDQRRDKVGMYTEFDGKGVYGAVKQFEFNEPDQCVRVELVPEKVKGIEVLSIEISGLEPGDRLLLATMAKTFKDYPR